MLSLLAGLALATPLDGWADSRWLIEVEETFPVHLSIAGPDATPAVIRAIQVQTVMHCTKFEMAGKKAAYASCTFEEMALRASPQAPPGDRLDAYRAGLANLEKALETGTAELKIKLDGKVAQMDFHEPPKTDEFVTMAARAITADLLSGFSLQRVDVPAGSPWDEKNSPIIRAATQPIGGGQTKIRHQPVSQDGVNLIQSSGTGTYTSMYMSWAAGRPETVGAGVAASGAYGAAAQGGVFPTRTFDAGFNSVTVEADEGPLKERIWSLQSTPKPDPLYTATGASETPLWSSGHIRRLTADEKAELGTSGLVSAPGAKFPELPEWTPLESVGG